ncbi:MAG: arylesterase [Sphingomonadales bacterium]|nr:MAG: arylesterase [Sphingomonadales bacterium]
MRPTLGFFSRLLLSSLLLLASAPAMAADRLVVAFGDSLTAGYNLGPGEGFAPQLDAALPGVTVHDAGVSGETSAGGLARLDWVLNSLKRTPDLVILELGANDMLRGQPPEQAKANLDAMLAKLRQRRIKVLLAGMLAAPNLGADYGKRFNAIYPALARKHAVPLYPFFLDGVAGNRALQLADGMHPNKAGVAVMVRNILPSVRAALEGSGHAAPVRGH